MKLKGLVSVLICLGCFTGCNKTSDDPVILTYGSEIDNAATEIKDKEFTQMIENKESFVLCIYPSTSCSCWTSLNKIINNYVSNNPHLIYKISGVTYGDELNLPYYSGESSIAIYEKGKLKNHWRYNDDDSKEYFQSAKKFASLMDEYTIAPSMIWTDKEHLEEHLNDDILNVVHMRKDCSDCSYCFPNVLIPYFEEKDTAENPLYVIDLAVDGILYEGGEEKGKDYGPYLEYATEFELTEDANSLYGYGEGYVPTFQRWEKGQLDDACVYLNDKVSKNDDGEYYISETFYTEKRVSNLHYVADVLEGKIVTENEVYTGDDYVTYNPSSFAKYHNPNLYNFLDIYVY